MQFNYPEALRLVLKHEGGYTNDAEDPGGPTNWGITIYDARSYWKPGATAADVKAMPLEVAKQIYKSKYWDRMECDRLPSGVDYCVFDYGVNSGVGRAVPIYGKFKSLPVAQCINAICDERLHFLQGLKTWPTFGKGWSRRVTEVRAASLAMAQAVTPPDIPAPQPQPEPVPSRNIWLAIIEFFISLFRGNKK